MDGFIEISRGLFNFLEVKYGYELIAIRDGDGCSYLMYSNKDVGIGFKLLYELSSSFVFVLVYRLIEGEFRDNCLPISDDTEITCIDFNDTLMPEHKMRPAYEYGEESSYFDAEDGLRNYVEEFSSRLRLFGKNILIGDLSIFPEIEKIIKRRAKEFQ